MLGGLKGGKAVEGERYGEKVEGECIFLAGDNGSSY